MFFSKIDREEFEILKKDFFFISGQTGKLTRRIEELESREKEILSMLRDLSQRINSLLDRVERLERADENFSKKLSKLCGKFARKEARK